MQEKHDFFRFGNMCDREGLEIEYFKEATRDAFNIFSRNCDDPQEHSSRFAVGDNNQTFE